MRRTVPVLALMLIAVACTTGSGNIVSEPRTVGEFTSVSASGGVDVQLVVEPGASYAVTVNYDDNLLSKIRTEVVGDTLEIESEGFTSISGGGRRFVEVRMPTLVRLDASGGSDITGRGSVGRLAVNASGGADVDLSSVDAEEVEVSASGGADLTVKASISVRGSASGGADVTILGDPSTIDVSTSGGADVRTG